MNSKLLESIIQSRTIVLSDGVSGSMVERTTQLLTFMEAEDDKRPITVLVNSPGGEAYSGLGLYDTLRFIRPPINIIVNGLCASAGILLLLSAEKDRRFSLPHSRFMIHQPRGGARGTSSDIQIEATEIKTLRRVYFEIIADRCGKAVETLEKDADRDFWIDAKAAQEYGLITRVVTHRGEID